MKIFFTIIILSAFAIAKTQTTVKVPVYEHFTTYSDGSKTHLFFKQTYPSVKLRHGYIYEFNLKFRAYKAKLGLKSQKTLFTSSGDYSKNNSRLAFDWTKKIKKNNYILEKNTSETIIASKKKYDVYYHPVTRKKDNLLIEYKIEYYEEKDKHWVGPYYFHSIQPYEITWCGDGIVDRYEDYASGDLIFEECDPNDKNKKDWGKHGCSTDCKIKN